MQPYLLNNDNILNSQVLGGLTTTYCAYFISYKGLLTRPHCWATKSTICVNPWSNSFSGWLYIGQIEEIVQIACALQHRGTPSENDKVAALVVWLNSIQRLESESSSSLPLSPTNIAFLTPTIPCHLQVMASTTSSWARVHAVASGPAPSQQCTTWGQRGAGSQACQMGARVPRFRWAFMSELSCCLLTRQEELRHCLP